MPHDKELFRAPNLTQENHERWFRQMKIQLEGKGLFYTVQFVHYSTRYACDFITYATASTRRSLLSSTELTPV
jgi:hypothetical protein